MAWALRYKHIKERDFPASLLINLRVAKGPQPLKLIPALTACASKRMKTRGFRTLRVLPPGGTPQRVSSAPFPGAELHALRERQNPKKLEKVAFSHFFDTQSGVFPLFLFTTEGILCYNSVNNGNKWR